jgi:hypothetical protein
VSEWINEYVHMLIISETGRWVHGGHDRTFSLFWYRFKILHTARKTDEQIN